jgi:S-DNA-T family DNA segregation ATPase FtsK/SpoIIIE
MADLPPVPGRGVAAGTFCAGRQAICQLFVLEGRNAGPGKVTPRGAAVQGPVRTKPFRVDPLPARVSVADVLSRMPAPSILPGMPGHEPHGRDKPALRTAAQHLVVGLGGDEPAPAAVPLPKGAVLAVLGTTGAGKSSLLASLPELNPLVSGWRQSGPDMSAEEFLTAVHRDAVEGRLRPETIILVDDADLLPPACHQHLVDLNSRGCAVIFSAAFSPSLLQRVPLALAARSGGRGILIAPRSPMDGDIFGLRIEPDSHPPPGRALLVSDGTALPVQLAVV